MSFWKVFFAVVLANIVSWIVISIIAWIFWISLFSSLGSALGNRIDRDLSSSPILTPGHPSAPRVFKQIEQLKHVVPQNSQSIQNPTKPKLSASARKKNYEMCLFWSEEARKEPTVKYKAYRDAACKRHRKYR